MSTTSKSTKAVAPAQATSTPRSLATQLGMTFPIGRELKNFRTQFPHLRIGGMPVVYMATVLETLMAEICNSVVSLVRESGQKRLQPSHIRQVLENHEVLRKLAGSDFQIMRGGMREYMHSELLKSKTRKTRKTRKSSAAAAAASVASSGAPSSKKAASTKAPKAPKAVAARQAKKTVGGAAKKSASKKSAAAVAPKATSTKKAAAAVAPKATSTKKAAAAAPKATSTKKAAPAPAAKAPSVKKAPKAAAPAPAASKKVSKKAAAVATA